MTALNDCGCCEGLTVETPVAVSNRPGLSAIVYRAGTHAQFKASMMARLSAADLLELGRLKTRDDDDFTIALLDAWALSGDILTFYQERIANESYLRTATERQSVINLARLIGYELRPGVAATTYLAFLLETGIGSPTEVTLDSGMRVQSVPGPGEKPQTFETTEQVVARPEWNLLKPQLTEIQRPRANDTQVVLGGVATNLKVGDALLIAPSTSASATERKKWEFRRISEVEPDTANGRTIVRWTDKLANVPEDPHVFALRLRASIFGFNAPFWKALPIALRIGETNPDPKATGDDKFKAGAFADKENAWAEAKFAKDATEINLDSAYSQVIPESWLVLTSGNVTQPDGVTLPGATQAYRVAAVVEQAVVRFNITGKSTLVTIDGEGIESFTARSASVFAQSEELTLAGTTLTTAVRSTEIVLDGVVNGLPIGRALLVADATSAEPVTIEEATLSADGQCTVLTLAKPGLTKSYDRATTSIFANVAFSTNGETVKDEVLGSGDAGQPYQHFSLGQFPLTYTPADSASGAASTLEVRVNELKWTEVPTLFDHGPRERIYVTNTDDDGTTTVQFGDGLTGARLPVGRENVTATYRKGIGLSGLVQGGQLTLLMTRPLGVRGVTNPMPSSAAQDPQSLTNARTNAPVAVLTLDRIVSLQDYEDFARAFSGIAKALATWTWSGHTRQVFVTVAGIDGAAVAPRSVLQASLLSAMQKAGDGFVPIAIKSYREATFKVVAAVKVDPAYVTGAVLAAVEAALRASFSFAARAFGQPVTLSEVITVMQYVDGVVAVDVTKLHRADQPETRETFLLSDSPQVGAGPGVLAAELLTLDADRIELTVMP
jgi:predicted phage baseplate assembly protein